MPCSRQAEEHHRDPGLIRVPIHALVPLKLKYPYYPPQSAKLLCACFVSASAYRSRQTEKHHQGQ